jgi:hypothetical protein
MAVSSLALGAVAFLFASSRIISVVLGEAYSLGWVWSPIITIITGVVGLVLGILSLKRSRFGRAMAISGIVLSSAAVLPIIILFFLVIALFSML